MRKFMNLFETIADEFTLNAEIERLLEPYEGEDRVLIRDGLEIIKMAGEHGVAISQWVASMQHIHQKDYDVPKLRMIFREMMNTFPFLIHRVGDSAVYKWEVVQRAPVDDIDTTSPMAQLAQQQVHITSEILDLMKHAQVFRPEDIAHQINSVPYSVAEMLVHHILDSMSTLVKPMGDGRYQIAPETKPKSSSENMAFWRGLAARGDEPEPDLS